MNADAMQPAIRKSRAYPQHLCRVRNSTNYLRGPRTAATLVVDEMRLHIPLLLACASPLAIGAIPGAQIYISLQSQGIVKPAGSVAVEDGHILFPYKGETHQTYYKVFGDLDNHTRVPVVVLHGGPGLSHDYMLPNADLADEPYGYPVIFYDQIGNARSTHLPDEPEDFWSVDLFLDELENILAHFKIQDRYYIVGHSWGGMLAAEFVVRRQPKGLRRLVIADAPSATALWRQSFMQLLQEFPEWVKEAIGRGFEDRETYWKALGEVYAVHGCRVQPMPEDLEYSLLQVYGEGADLTVKNAS